MQVFGRLSMEIDGYFSKAHHTYAVMMLLKNLLLSNHTGLTDHHPSQPS